MTLAEQFDQEFGEGEAAKLIAHCHTHDNGIHDKPGSDEFRWAIMIALGFNCAKYDIGNFTEEKLWDFCLKNKEYLLQHDGDVDFLALFCGAYNFLKEEDIKI